MRDSSAISVGNAESKSPGSASQLGQARNRGFLRHLARVMKRLAGLMSRWTMPFPWAATNASAIWVPNSTTRLRVSLAVHRGPASSVSPSRHSITKKGLLSCLRQIVDGADVGVVERRGGPGLTLKAFQGLRSAGQLFRQELQRHPPTEVQVFGFVDDTHTAAAELASGSDSARRPRRSSKRSPRWELAEAMLPYAQPASVYPLAAWRLRVLSS